MNKDKQILKDVVNELKWNPSIDDSDIHVAVKKGIVTLFGNARSYLEKFTAGNVARHIRDVKAVVQDIEVTIQDNHRRADEDIAAAALAALSSNHQTSCDTIRLLVDDGHITLEGEVEWQYQKEAAASVLCAIIGVKDIANYIVVKPRAHASVVGKDIRLALKRRSELNKSRIAVTAKGNHVLLKGSVGSIAEKNIALFAAWSAPGVSAITDQIKVVH